MRGDDFSIWVMFFYTHQDPGAFRMIVLLCFVSFVLALGPQGKYVGKFKLHNEQCRMSMYFNKGNGCMRCIGLSMCGAKFEIGRDGRILFNGPEFERFVESFQEATNTRSPIGFFFDEDSNEVHFYFAFDKVVAYSIPSE